MSTTLAPPSVTITPVPVSVSLAKPLKRWLIGPWFDLLFVANLAWPLALLAYWLHLLNAESAQPVGEDSILVLFQVYFLSTPHRWITLVLVFCDSERFWKEPAKFGGLGLGLVAIGVGLVAVAGFLPYAGSSLMLLMMLDYIWNAWHFAAQHAGIARIYGRMTRPEQALPHAEFEKMALRTLVMWVFFRFAVHMALNSIYSDSVAWLAPWLAWLDPLALVPVSILLYREISVFRPQCLGRVLYIGSVTTIYSAQLLAIHLDNRLAMLALFFAGAIFHAVEYLAVCNWAVQKRTTGIWRYQITRTSLAVFVFMAVLGTANYFVNAQSVYAWQLMTLLVSLLHYAYDGIIWRARPAPAKAG